MTLNEKCTVVNLFTRNLHPFLRRAAIFATL